MVANHCIWKRLVLPDGLVSHMRDGCHKPEKLSTRGPLPGSSRMGWIFPQGAREFWPTTLGKAFSRCLQDFIRGLGDYR